MWRQKITNVSEHLFPGLVNYNSIINDDHLKIGTEVLSNLPLQMSLYFNVIYFPCWLIVMMVMLPIKFWEFSVLHRLILILAITAVIIIELVRLYMGYVGNLKEKIPELAGFWLISLLLQTPLQVFILLSKAAKPFHLELLMQSVMCIFLIVQLISGFVALRHAAKHSVDAFHIAHFNLGDQGHSFKTE